MTEKKVAHQQTNAITKFTRETVGELRKVNWPTWVEARTLTIIVLIVIATMAIFLGAIDIGVSRLFIIFLGGA